MKNNIILIGMPGCGKSTVGVVLAKALGFRFTDTDLLICEKQGKKLQQILDEQGIEAFLKIEAKTGEELNCSNTVIATGGSMVMNAVAMEHLKDIGHVVYIQVPFQTLKQRIKNMKTRGIVFGKNETLEDIYRIRTPLYKKYADITVNIERQELEDTVHAIVQKLADKTNCI